MGLLKRIAGIFGLVKDDGHEPGEEEEEDGDRGFHGDGYHRRSDGSAAARKGFSVKVPVTVDRAPSGPLIVPCSFGDGGVQGLCWYAKKLRIDEDGDVADEFLDEVYPESSLSEDRRVFPKFEVKYSARPVLVRNQVISDGSVLQNVEFRGRLLWV